MGHGFQEEVERKKVKLGPSENTSHTVRIDARGRLAQDDSSHTVWGTCMKQVRAKRKRWQ